MERVEEVREAKEVRWERRRARTSVFARARWRFVVVAKKSA
jgi:hypothetical protein